MKTEIDKDFMDEITNRGHTLVAQAKTLTIVTDQDLSVCADMTKVTKSLLKKADDKRKENYTGPLNAVIKRINSDFKAMVAPLQEAAQLLGSKMTTYVRDKERIEQERQRQIAKEAEERALKEAEALQDAGKQDEAEIALEQGTMVADLVKESRPMPVRGDYGAVASTRKTWAFELENIRDVPARYLLLDEQEVRVVIRSQVRQLQEEARKGGLSGKSIDVYVENKMKDFTIPGIKIYQKVDAVVR